MINNCETVIDFTNCREIFLREDTEDCSIKTRYTYSIVNNVPTKLLLKIFLAGMIGVFNSPQDFTVIVILRGFELSLQDVSKVHICDVTTTVANAEVLARPLPEGMECSDSIKCEFSTVTLDPTTYPSSKPSVSP